MDTINQKFAEELRRLRTEKNITQEKLAQLAGIDYKYLQKLEGKNPSSPTLSTMAKLANGLGISLADLIASVDTET